MVVLDTEAGHGGGAGRRCSAEPASPPQTRLGPSTQGRLVPVWECFGAGKCQNHCCPEHFVSQDYFTGSLTQDASGCESDAPTLPFYGSGDSGLARPQTQSC